MKKLLIILIIVTLPLFGYSQTKSILIGHTDTQIRENASRMGMKFDELRVLNNDTYILMFSYKNVIGNAYVMNSKTGKCTMLHVMGPIGELNNFRKILSDWEKVGKDKWVSPDRLYVGSLQFNEEDVAITIEVNS